MIEQMKPRTDVEAMLASRYGLTRRQAQFVVTLTVADQVRAASDTLGISAQTGRLHLARAFRKIGVHSQRELMALLCHLSSE
jgi:DNA-binding CsgD family transcriptional regulator